MATCACGCGEAVSEGRSYKVGHWSRTAEAKAGYAARRTHPEPPNPSGLCQCGCGRPTTIANATSAKSGSVKGHPTKYLRGHGARGGGGPGHHLWKGGRIYNDGYVLVLMPDDPRANSKGYVAEHRLVWEHANGRALAPGEHIHHINGVRDDNRPENLVALTRSEHQRLHMQAEDNGLRRYHAAHPDANSESGRKGAAARWGSSA